MKISLAILVMNEINAVRVMFDRIPWKAVDEVAVVDGNSKDGTPEFFREKGLRVVTQKAPGMGEAMLTARAAVTGDAILFYHPDGNEDPDEIPKFRRYLEQGYDFVIPSRMLRESFNEEDGKFFRPRKWANLFFAFIANCVWRRGGTYASDVTQGFRAVTCQAFDAMCLNERGATLDYQMVIRALKKRMKIYEFPTREGECIGGETKFKAIPTGLRMLQVFFYELFIGQRVFRQSYVRPPLQEPALP